MTEPLDITGRKFNRLTAIRRIGSKNNGSLWLCVCDCGSEREATVSNLGGGSIRMCRECSKRVMQAKAKSMGLANERHGLSRTVVYGRYNLMIGRCYNPKNDSYEYYGGRGIKVCDEWLNSREAFMSWALSSGFDPSLSIDRIDNDGDYSPGNCRWANDQEQHRNRSDTRILELDGVSMSLCDWAEKIGMKSSTLGQRITRGWSDRRALTTPVIMKQSRKS